MDCLCAWVMQINRYILMLFVGIFFTLLSGQSNASHEQSHVTIQLPLPHHVQFAGYYMAKHKGFFAEAGLEVDLRPRNSKLTPLKAVESEQAEYAISNSDILIARANGSKIIAMAAIFQHSPAALLALKDEGIFQISDLNDKRIMLLPELEDIELIALLRKMRIYSINLQESYLARDINHLINHQFDAFSINLTNGPYHFVKQGLEPVTFTPRDYGMDFYSDYLFTSEKELAQNPERVDAVLNAVLQGWGYALTHTEETLDVIMQNYNNGLSRELLKYQLVAMRDFIMPDFVPLGYINQQRFSDIQQQLKDTGLLNSDVNLSNFIYEKKLHKFNWEVWGPWVKGIAAALLFNGIWLSYLLVVNQKLKREIVERRRAEQRVRHAAMHDHLTGLPNRAQLMEKLNHLLPIAEQGKISPALLFMDLDRFKAVNDLYGHAAGDELLIAVTQRICSLLNTPGIILARLGGDEFVILLPDSDLGSACELTEQIERVLLQSFSLSVCTVSVGISIGYSLYRQGMSADCMLTSADNLMYEVKSEHHQKRKKTAC